MARSGRFGTLPAAAQDLSSTIASMVAQYENARDRNIENAWKTPGEKFEGKPVTDKRFLDWWKSRRKEVSDDDPMADYYDQMIMNYQFQIGEQKATLAYTQGKLSESGMAAFYVKEAAKVPRNSAIWRDLMTNAARFKKAAAQAHAARSSQSQVNQFQNQWAAIQKRYQDPATAVQGVLDEVTQAAEAVGNIWGVSPGQREGLDLDSVLAKIETDPATAAMWPKWKARLEAADPGFRGHLTVEYLGHLYQRAKMGSRKQAELAKRHGYSSYEKAAHKDMDTYDREADGLSVWDEAQKAQQWYQTAVSQGINDPTKTPQERAKARASLITKMSKLQQKALSEGKTTFAGKLLEDIRTLQGDTRGGQREGVITASSLSSLSGFQEGSSAAEAQLAQQAAADNDAIDKLGSGESVLVAQPDGSLVPVASSTAISHDPAGQATQVVPVEGYTTIDKHGKPEVVPGGATTIVRQGMPVQVQVGGGGALDETTGTYTSGLANAPGRSGTVGYRYDMGGGKVAWQLYQGDGTIVWTYDDPFESGMVRSQVNDNGTWVVTADPHQGTTAELVPGATPADDTVVANPRSVLKDQFELTPEQRKQQRQQAIDDAAAQRSLIAPGLDTSGWSEQQRAKFGGLSQENQRFLIDRGLTGITPAEMSDATLDKARGGGTAMPAGWRPTPRRAGIDATDAQGQPTDPQEKARRDLYGIEQKLDSYGSWVPHGDHADDIRALLDQRRGIIDKAGFPESVKRLYEERLVDSSAGAIPGVGVLTTGDPKKKKADAQAEIDRLVTTDQGPDAGQPYTDPIARLNDIEGKLKSLRQMGSMGSRAITGPVDPTPQIKELEAERAKLLQQPSVKGYYQAAGKAVVQTVVDVATQVRAWMTGKGITDGKNPTPVEQPNGYTTFTALFYSQDQPHRAELAKLSDQQITVELLRSDPSLANDPARFATAMQEIGTIQRNANTDNGAYARDRMENDGLPTTIADSMTSDRGGRSGGPAQQGGGQPSGAAGGLPGAGQGQDQPDGGRSRLPGGATEPDVTGPFIWGGGKRPVDDNVGVHFGANVAAQQGAAGAAGATDRPTLKLPSFGSSFWGTGNLSAQQALQEQQRLNAERVRASASYDPVARAPVPPATGSRARPAPAIKTPRPAPSEGKLPPPPKPKAPPPVVAAAKDPTTTLSPYSTAYWNSRGAATPTPTKGYWGTPLPHTGNRSGGKF